MVRRSTVDRSPQSAVHGAGYEAGAEHLETGVPVRGHPSRGWGGAGGRWLVWTFRAVLWAALLVILSMQLREPPRIIGVDDPWCPIIPGSAGL